jgi:DNA-binding transcriptional MerR regulator
MVTVISKDGNSMKAYLKQDIAKRIGRSISVVQSWVDHGLVMPEVMPAQGRGFARIYSEKNLIEFSFVNILLSYKLRLDTIRDIMNHVRKADQLKDFFTGSRWKNDFSLIFSMDNEGGSLSNIMFRITHRGSSPPLVEEMLEDHVASAITYVRLDKVLAEAKKRIGME